MGHLARGGCGQPADSLVPTSAKPSPQGDTMRFMMFVRADKNTEAGVLPSQELITAMGRFNEEMVKAGVMLAGEGIQPSAKSARITFLRGKTTVTDGPFPARELVA